MEKNYLWEKLGSTIQHGLTDKAIFEIMLNPDGNLWFKHKTKGNIKKGMLEEKEVAAFVNALAQSENKFLNEKTPYLDATLPFAGERINITVPPLNARISFNIRKKALKVFTLQNYIEHKIITTRQAHALSRAIDDRQNILISGSPGSGKTTFANALLAEMADQVSEGHRVLILEQVSELQCRVKNLKTMLTTEHVSMNGLLWIAMRNSPDRIVIGEVRDGAALELLKAWNTGCPGGIATIHANRAEAAVQRVLDLACEVAVNPPYALAAEALNIIVQIEERASHTSGRLVTGMVKVDGFDPKTQTFQFVPLC